MRSRVRCRSHPRSETADTHARARSSVGGSSRSAPHTSNSREEILRRAPSARKPLDFTPLDFTPLRTAHVVEFEHDGICFTAVELWVVTQIGENGTRVGVPLTPRAIDDRRPPIGIPHVVRMVHRAEALSAMLGDAVPTGSASPELTNRFDYETPGQRLSACSACI